jgi:hypothetical protein
MKRLRIVLLVMVVQALGLPASADIAADMRSISQFCLQYVETGQVTDVLLREAFRQRGRKFHKSYNASVIGGTKPVITVDPRKSRSGFSCSANFGIISRGDGQRLMNTASEATRQRGYVETVVTTSRGGRKPAFVMDGVAVQLGGGVRSEYSTHSATIYFQRLN